MIVYRLPEAQRNYPKKQVPITTNQEITRKVKRSQVVYKTRYSRRILQGSHQRERGVENSLSNKIQPIQIPGYAIWINKCTSNIPGADQPRAIQPPEQVCYCIPRQHTDILGKQRRSQKTC